ncbi:hypothetical protein CQS04_08845 [Chryseomicrobium excrementi]|uniref:DUF86 domain-containing protein n=1 Tax=Chryseomicrobium excrementi TaxID=2041346 RepID=A0A2M9F1A2_9BACL|nr:DUF86 domain-containing protein [Chryseomicrobium excrementi]PJK17239.1 hypothetical protein CQS04_08845 [Chryseomicrobium excrementi]
MYFVDRKRIEVIASHLEELLAVYENKQQWEPYPESHLILERVTGSVIESILDIGNAMIDGFIMRDPGSYDDIIDILVDEKVVTADMDKGLKEIVGLRKQVVREYYAVDRDNVVKVFDANLSVIRAFPGQVRKYLVNELGPVSAFLPEDSNVQL